MWWGLRLGPDGAAPSGYPVVVFDGRHADVVLDESMGAALGQLVGTHPLACVVDVSDLAAARRVSAAWQRIRFRSCRRRHRPRPKDRRRLAPR